VAKKMRSAREPTVLDPGSVAYAAKRVLLGKPLITRQLAGQKLTNKIALGVLSPDAISSSAYGPEQMLVELLPAAGAAAFALVLPVTAAILVILVLVAASYRQIVMAYTRQGGSYVVARDNFGPRVAQIASAALLIDYVVTVAVQAAAGTVAVVSAVPILGPYRLEITIGVVLLLCYMNLRGLREAGRPFAVPTYFFVIMISAMIITGVVRLVFFGGLPQYNAAHLPGAVPVHHESGLVAGATVLVLLRSFANGGSSLTGVEAISDSVSAFRAPRGPNARKVLLVMASTLGFLLAGISFLAFVTHATPYQTGYPSVLSQEARAIFGHNVLGDVFYVLVQAASALILYTGANTSFNGFPFLASFVATDRFLPRQLTTRGHRLVFSNGIIVLTALAVVLLAVTGSSVTALVPFYAIGVFSGFAMAGYGMTKYHRTHREPGWQRKQAINLAAAIASTVVVLIFAIAKFTEGAWVVVVVFPLLVLVLMRLNREYRAESAVLERVTSQSSRPTNYARHQVFVLVNRLDLAVIEALRYGTSLRPDKITAIHLVIDTAAAEALRERWEQVGMNTSLRVVDVPDRRIARAARALVTETIEANPSTGVTVLLPRRSYAPLLGRLLHDRTADRIARGVSRIPQAAATIVPFDVQSRIRAMLPKLPEARLAAPIDRLLARLISSAGTGLSRYEHPGAEPDTTPLGDMRPGATVIADGRLHEITDTPSQVPGQAVMSAELVDDTGRITIEFSHLHPDLETGQLLRLSGLTSTDRPDHPLVIRDPHYQILEDADQDPGTENGG
jgi:amino acid transporter